MYCRYLDDADFERWAGLFANGRMVFHLSPDEPPIIFDRDPEGLAAFERKHTRLHDGKPSTLYASVNALIDIDDSGTTARCESNVLVLQQTEHLPLQAIAAAIDSDIFEKVDGVWRYAERQARPLLLGDMSEHTKIDVTEG